MLLLVVEDFDDDAEMLLFSETSSGTWIQLAWLSSVTECSLSESSGEGCDREAFPAALWAVLGVASLPPRSTCQTEAFEAGVGASGWQRAAGSASGSGSVSMSSSQQVALLSVSVGAPTVELASSTLELVADGKEEDGEEGKSDDDEEDCRAGLGRGALTLGSASCSAFACPASSCGMGDCCRASDPFSCGSRKASSACVGSQQTSHAATSPSCSDAGFCSLSLASINSSSS
mmetsp:Transcript_2170/g.5121  ORF Transcript_2170/g.5121 Transcript_2170/m.5121 type:complete len:232 (-) Transcript_2170:276-971(-)